ncbi:aldose epimerase family protein [Lapidilactobacillus salsurivasis]
MTVRLANFGSQNGRSLYAITIENDNGVRVTIINYGAAIWRLEVPSNQGHENIILSLPKIEDYLNQRTYFGAIVGRVAGRLPMAVWKIGGRSVSLENNDSGRHKHGGTEGLDRRIFSIQSLGDNSVTMRLLDSDGNNGYPGNMIISVTYKLTDNDILQLHIEGLTDKLTLFNPTNHTYFSLDGPGTNILDQDIAVNSSYIQPVNQNNTPVSGWTSVAESVFDLKRPNSLRKILTSQNQQIKLVGGLNHAFLLDSSAGDAVTLMSRRNCRQVTLQTDAPAVVIYTGNHFRESLTSAIPHWGGIALEAQVAPEYDEDWSDISLLPGSMAERNIAWHFKY